MKGDYTDIRKEICAGKGINSHKLLINAKPKMKLSKAEKKSLISLPLIEIFHD